MWTGRQARQIGLVDELGRADDVRLPRPSSGRTIPADEEVELDIYPRARSFYEVLTDQFRSPVGELRDARPPRKR